MSKAAFLQRGFPEAVPAKKGLGGQFLIWLDLANRQGKRITLYQVPGVAGQLSPDMA